MYVVDHREQCTRSRDIPVVAAAGRFSILTQYPVTDSAAACQFRIVGCVMQRQKASNADTHLHIVGAVEDRPRGLSMAGSGQVATNLHPDGKLVVDKHL